MSKKKTIIGIGICLVLLIIALVILQLTNQRIVSKKIDDWKYLGSARASDGINMGRSKISAAV